MIKLKIGKVKKNAFSISPFYLIVYPSKWSVCGKTKSDLADNSQALHNEAALSAATTSSPTINETTVKDISNRLHGEYNTWIFPKEEKKSLKYIPGGNGALF